MGAVFIQLSALKPWSCHLGVIEHASSADALGALYFNKCRVSAPSAGLNITFTKSVWIKLHVLKSLFGMIYIVFFAVS